MSYLSPKRIEELKRNIAHTAECRDGASIVLLVKKLAACALLTNGIRVECTLRPHTTTKKNTPVIAEVTRDKQPIIVAWCIEYTKEMTEGEIEAAREQAEENLKALMVKVNVECGLLMDADKAMVYKMCPAESCATFDGPWTFTYKDDVIDLINRVGYFANNPDGPDTDESEWET